MEYVISFSFIDRSITPHEQKKLFDYMKQIFGTFGKGYAVHSASTSLDSSYFSFWVDHTKGSLLHHLKHYYKDSLPIDKVGEIAEKISKKLTKKMKIMVEFNAHWFRGGIID